MRSEYGRLLRRHFAAAMSLRLPQFEATKSDGFPGERAFVQKPQSDLWKWIIVVPNQKDDNFTLELGWSSLGRDPRQGRAPLLSPSKAQHEPEYMCRIGQVLGKDMWWHVDSFMRTTEAKDILGSMPGALQSDPSIRIRVCASAAMDVLVRVGVPYLEARST